MADVFISYAREDHERARQLASALDAQEYSVWWDRELITGERYDIAIERELDAAKSVVVLWSKDSIGSEWVRNEAAAAAEREVLIPALLDTVKPPLEFRRRHTVDLAGWRGDPGDINFQTVCRAVSVNVGRPPVSPISPPKPISLVERFARRLSKIKPAPIIMLAAVIVAVTLSIRAPTSIRGQQKAGVSDTPIVSNVYTHPAGSFERQGEIWVEYPPYSPGRNFQFKEARRDGEFIYLFDETRHKAGDPLRIMYLRLPIAGGMAQWSYPNPFIWQDLYPVTPKQQ
ncbi:TIR domain-containing protein [Cupriavidus sp. YR651]|uniref:toll/interleukin-1 receptor domain-containing protein n=1 Tax=Cupriavidus sp. YR651 TaxID=1855315 RepID=UPI000889D121|nr:toll/interleukin-1 receptor domain-containing protein [Cupriavidus sp. YR651]SDC68145.1 TIR domain-containing protein [Cupriavidus sp. YR651]